MKVGDLVEFHSSFFSNAVDTYANPGVIISDEGTSVGTSRRFRVMWSNSKMTTEHSGYLKVINERR